MVLGNDASSSSLSNKNLSVLVVDDDPLIRMLHDNYLKHFGLKSHVENGKEAVELFQLGTYFNLILMDNEMPIMNGVEATKVLRDMGSTSMIVGVTSRGSPSEMQTFMEAGLDFCFEKPLTFDMIDFILKELNMNDDDDDTNN
ncbi:hypothetical protein V6N13_066769 [Hibiscus sabdariffa]